MLSLARETMRWGSNPFTTEKAKESKRKALENYRTKIQLTVYACHDIIVNGR